MTTSQLYTGHYTNGFTPLMTYPAGDISGTDPMIEIGPGRGDFLFHLARMNPERIVYGVEIRDKRFGKLVTRRDANQLYNIRLVFGDGAVAITELFEKESVAAIYVNFPDPWPRNRHNHKRLLKQSFIKNCAERLKPSGALFIATDVEWYASETFATCKGVTELECTTTDITTESDEAFPTLFAQKWKKQGRKLYYQKYFKRS